MGGFYVSDLAGAVLFILTFHQLKTWPHLIVEGSENIIFLYSLPNPSP